MKKINFTKMHGLGNDFILLEDLENKYNNESDLALKLCHRNFGIGADGVIFVRKSDIAHIQMVIYNADGSYASMCGNGIRCFAKYIWDNGIVKDNPLKIETGDGIKIADLSIENGKVNKVTINLGKENFNVDSIPANYDEEIINKKINVNGEEVNITSMRMGVPHTVVMGSHHGLDVSKGKFIEKHRIFPEGTNVNFCEVLNSKEIKVKTWERGAGATLACGTGSCAAVIACNKLGLTDKKVIVHVPGGDMEIELRDSGVYMTGPAVVAFQGETDTLI